MKTKEFVKRVKELGYEVSVYEVVCLIFNNGVQVATISNLESMEMSNFFCEYDKLSDEDKEKLFNLMVEYASTPIEDRVEEKKFYLKHRFLTSLLGDMKYSFINYNAKYNEIFLSNKESLGDTKTQFTLKEIEEIKERFDTDLADFEMVEVKDEQ